MCKARKTWGRKEVWRCQKCLTDMVLPDYKPQPKCPRCQSETERMLKPVVKKGKVVANLPNPKEIRKYVLTQLEKLSLE